MRGIVTKGTVGRCDRYKFNDEILALEHGFKAKGDLTVTLGIIDEILDDFKGIILGLQKKHQN